MATFTEKLTALGQGSAPKAAALTFLSDLSSEDRQAFRDAWPQLPAPRRRQIVEMLGTMAEDAIIFVQFRMFGTGETSESAIE